MRALKKKKVPVKVNLDVRMVGVVGGMHTVITNSTHSSKEVIEVSTNGFPKRKKLSGYGLILVLCRTICKTLPIVIQWICI